MHAGAVKGPWVYPRLGSTRAVTPSVSTVTPTYPAATPRRGCGGSPAVIARANQSVTARWIATDTVTAVTTGPVPAAPTAPVNTLMTAKNASSAYSETLV